MVPEDYAQPWAPNTAESFGRFVHSRPKAVVWTILLADFQNASLERQLALQHSGEVNRLILGDCWIVLRL